MKEYILNLWDKFKKKSIIFKILMCLILVLYIGVLYVCFAKVNVIADLPGSITNVSSVISIDSNNEPGNIYTVSIYSPTKMSVLEYWLSSLDENSSVKKGQQIQYDIFTEKEYYNTNVGYKNQSIQDSIIVAYKSAMERSFDVKLEYQYEGEYLINIPQNLYKTGSEDFKIGDVVTKINDVEITSEEVYYRELNNIFDSISYNDSTIKKLCEQSQSLSPNEYVEKMSAVYSFLNTLEQTIKVVVNRNNKETELTPSYKMLFYLYSSLIFKGSNDNYTLYSIGTTRFSKYIIDYDKCLPKINISKFTTVGPSGGLLQALAVYNAITPDDITNGLRIMGTGGIDLEGNALTIGGEQQKVVTANLYGASVFFVPEENYDSAKEMYDKLDKKYYELVKVSNFNDVLKYFEEKVTDNE